MGFLTFVSALVVLITISARGADHPNKPSQPGIMPLIRLHAEKISLLTVGISAGAAILGVLTSGGVCPPFTMLLTGSALWMLTHPKGWLRYVASLADCVDSRRVDP